jgi:hypothetical protein
VKPVLLDEPHVKRQALREEGPNPEVAVAEAVAALEALASMGQWPGPRDTIESHPARLCEDAQQPDMIVAVPFRHCALRATTGCLRRNPLSRMYVVSKEQ